MGLRIDAKDFLANMSAIKQRSMFVRMGVSGNMEYSAYLELGHEGRFAILWATVQANEQKIMDDLRKVVR